MCMCKTAIYVHVNGYICICKMTIHVYEKWLYIYVAIFQNDWYQKHFFLTFWRICLHIMIYLGVINQLYTKHLFTCPVNSPYTHT